MEEKKEEEKTNITVFNKGESSKVRG